METVFEFGDGYYIKVKETTNFDWLVEEKKLTTFIRQLNGPSLSGAEVCHIWEIETPCGEGRFDPIEVIADWLTAPHIDKERHEK